MKALQGAGILAIVAVLLNLFHQLPATASEVFSPDYVAQIIDQTPPKSIRL